LFVTQTALLFFQRRSAYVALYDFDNRRLCDNSFFETSKLRYVDLLQASCGISKNVVLKHLRSFSRFHLVTFLTMTFGHVNTNMQILLQFKSGLIKIII